MLKSVPDKDLEMGGGVVIQTLRLGGGGVVSKKNFQSFGPQFGLKRRGAQASRAPPLDPPLEVIGQPQELTAQ